MQALPGVIAARHRVTMADAVVGLQRRERRPDLTLSLTGGYEDGERLIGLGVSIPLPIRNRFTHEVTAAMAERVQAQQLADDAVQMAHASLISAAERYELSRSVPGMSGNIQGGKAWTDKASNCAASGRLGISVQPII